MAVAGGASFRVLLAAVDETDREVAADGAARTGAFFLTAVTDGGWLDDADESGAGLAAEGGKGSCE